MRVGAGDVFGGTVNFIARRAGAIQGEGIPRAYSVIASCQPAR
jgi:hypothetical protein